MPWPVLSAAAAARLDAELMTVPGFSLDQLMELAGLSVACAVVEVYPPSSHPRALVVSGPGNNGGDGLVAARHLSHFGYAPRVVLPRRRPGDAGVANLLAQLEGLGVPVSVEMPTPADLLSTTDVVVDAVFGFSFAGPLREPFVSVLQTLSAVTEMRGGGRSGGRAAGCSGNSTAAVAGAGGELHEEAADSLGLPVVSVDVPSGWAVDDEGAEAVAAAAGGLLPSMLISLSGACAGIRGPALRAACPPLPSFRTAPKPCALGFSGAHHFLGGRFVPPAVAARFGIDALPPFPGVAQCVRLL